MSPLTTDRQKLIDRITKLLALANDPSAAPGEIENAQTKAAELMAKHNISVGESKIKDEFANHDLEDVDGDDRHDSTLCSAIAKFNDVMLIHITGGCQGTVLRIVGTRSDIEAYTYMQDVLFRQRTDSYLQAVIGGAEKRTDKSRREYFMGYAYGVRTLVNKLLAKRDNIITSMALVPVDNRKAAENWYEKNHGKLSNCRSLKPATYSQAGYNAGLNAKLNKGVGTKGALLAIGGAC